MRMIFEQDIEEEDFLELILSPTQAKKLMDEGIVKDFPEGLLGQWTRNLNVFIRVDKLNIGENMPLVSGKAAKSRKGFSQNIKREMAAGKKQSQAVAIAYSQARKGKKKSAKRGK